MAKDKRRDELLDELLGGAKTKEEIFGPDGILKRLTGALVERALRAELAEHLEQEKQQGTANRRNGSSEKTLYTEQAPPGEDRPSDGSPRLDRRRARLSRASFVRRAEVDDAPVYQERGYLPDQNVPTRAP